jgi:outer membrane protein assembly factor BamB
LPIRWRTNVGTGFATVAVSDGRIVTLGNRDNEDTVYCLDAGSGKVLWQYRYPCPLDPRYYEGGPSATPTIHGDSVYTLSKKGHAFRFELATGQVVWSRNLVADHDFALPEWSFASSPFIAGDLVVLNVGRGGLALAKATGATRWMSSTETSGYATVVPLSQNPSAATHLLFSARALIGFEATTGRQHWEFPWRSSRDVNAADPIVRGNRVLLSSSLGSKLLEIQAAGAPRILWQQHDMKWYFNPGVLIGDYVYSIHGTTHRPSELMCIRFDTGEIVWSEGGFASGALMAAQNTVVLLDSGMLTLFDASPEGFHPRLQQTVLEGKCWTVPVLANGRIYCRNAAGDLVAVEVAAAGGVAAPIGRVVY